MAFLAPAIPYALKAAPILAGMFGGGGNKGGLSKDGQGALAGLQGTQQAGANIAQSSNRAAQPLLGAASQYIPQSANYYQSILSGNRGQMLDAAAPDINNTSGQFNSARRAIAAGPRGGGRTSALAALPGQEAATKAGILSGQRPAAAQGLLQAGTQAGAMGSNLLNTGVQGLYAGANAGRSILDTDLATQKIQRERGGLLGQSIFDLVSSLPFGKGGKNMGPSYGPGY